MPDQYISIPSTRMEIPESPFFRSAVSIDVGPLDPDEFMGFLGAKFRKGRRKVSDGMIAEILASAESVPGDVQQLCGALFDVTSPGERISEESFPEALDLIFARESKGYEAALVRVTGLQLKCLTGLARLGGGSPTSAAFLEGIGVTHAASVKKALNRLVQIKIIYRYQGEYRFINPFFKRWLLWKGY